VALLLKRGGVRWVHPLHGGLAGWTDAGFPVEELQLVGEAGRAS
jgi:3-mercaptopyruvate sulfurtransferase SseA